MKVPIKKVKKIKLQGSYHCYEIMREVLFREAKFRRKQEYFWVIGLNAANRIEHIELVALGLTNRVTAKPKEVLGLALQKKCDRIILVHNHPSGTVKPSEVDKEFTKKMQSAAATVDIQILDHLIITEKGYFSFADMELI
jgi:DNA repair protein RadC